jgi:integrase
LQLRKHAGRRVWTVLYYKPDRTRGYHTLGVASEMTKGDAEEAAERFLREEVNGSDREAETHRSPTVSEFLDGIYLPFYRGKWKASTRATTEQRLTQHIAGELGAAALDSLTLARLQQFLQSLADRGHGHSTVNHVKFDLRSIFRMALAEGAISTDPTSPLYTPRIRKPKDETTMSQAQVVAAIAALPQREALMLHLALLVGMRPGEILALQRRHVSSDGLLIRIEQRVYVGLIDDPKTRGSRRGAAIAPETAAVLGAWMRDAVLPAPEAYVFASEAGTPLRPDNVMTRIIRPALAKVGLEWFNFQVARRTHA